MMRNVMMGIQMMGMDVMMEKLSLDGSVMIPVLLSVLLHVETV